MKYKLKLIFLLVLLFGCTGCSIEYNLTIDKKYATEKIETTIPKNEENNKLVDIYTKNNITSYYDSDSRKFMYYDIKKIDDDKSNNLKLIAEYEYPLKKLQYSNAIEKCLYNKSVNIDNKYITINTSEGFNCIYLDEVKQIDSIVVNITSKYVVEKTNADKIDGNRYTWNIDGDNYQNKSVYMKINYKEKYKNGIEKNALKIALGLLFFIIISIVIIILIKIKQNRKIK